MHRRQPGRVVQCADGRIGRTLNSDPIVNGKICVYLFPPSVVAAINAKTQEQCLTAAKQASTEISHEWVPDQSNRVIERCKHCNAERWNDPEEPGFCYSTGGAWSEVQPRCKPKDPEKRLCDPATLKAIGVID